jgi:hypothetical protein
MVCPPCLIAPILAMGAGISSASQEKIYVGTLIFSILFISGYLYHNHGKTCNKCIAPPS